MPSQAHGPSTPHIPEDEYIDPSDFEDVIAADNMRTRSSDERHATLSNMGMQRYSEMAGDRIRYNWKVLTEIAIEAIEKYDLIYQTEIESYLPCSSRQLQKRKFFKQPEIRAALMRKKISLKTQMRSNWVDADAPAQLQLAAYKLMADENELDRLGSRKNVRSKHEATHTIQIKFGDEPLKSDAIDATDIPYEELRDGGAEDELD